MEYRALGRTGVQVSVLCLGCMNFGDTNSGTTLRAREITVTEEDRQQINRIFEPGTHVSNCYNADFGPNARWQ